MTTNESDVSSDGSRDPIPSYSQATKDAHGAVILAGMQSDEALFVFALRQLATMVHCDLTGELREPHTLEPQHGTVVIETRFSK